MQKNLNLKIALFRKGMTQAELSKKTGIPESYLSYAIHGRFLLDGKQRKKICAVLRVTERELF